MIGNGDIDDISEHSSDDVDTDELEGACLSFEVK